MIGHLHPITQITEQISAYFADLGFEVVSGPEVETEEYNFDKLRVSADHPARDEQDTFYVKPGWVLRTHATNMQLRAMETRRPPVRIISPGRVYRNEATDATHNTTFHQLDMLVIAEDVTLAHLIGTLQGMMRHLIGDEIDFRIRPGFFPFVEPGLELDFRRPGQEWIEILGAGMVHPEVMAHMNVDSKKYRGFAFGMGVERLLRAMRGVDDVRESLSGDYRFLGQF